ncbi:hypothetical protein BDV96DRAFT_501034 [Lophiotrema nucula]|uniref:Rhodopsin domain-containing protein n=1 Tax=Lophiotrema nucula TaxID=690887 RepID=A0A6A5YW52_9PLEO|nr:hypothetical protein BDV96DRAFT_501034 [Lophiotrema nucula]
MSHPNRGPQLLGVDIAFMATALIANALRCYVRLTMVKAFGTDDWLMAVATIGFTCYCSFSIAGVHYGTGQHKTDLPVKNFQRGMNYWWYCYLFYCVSMITSKLSIGFFLLRIAVKKLHAWIIYAAMFISVVAGATFFFVTLFQCHPISYFWDKLQPGSCINVEVIVALGYLYSVFSIISDFTFAILPGFIVWKLQLNMRTKMALIPLLAMGCIASSAVVARLPYLGNFRNPDFLWATTDIAIWATVEQGLAITAGSLATLRPLFHVLCHKLGLTTNPSRARPSGHASPSASQMLGIKRKASQDKLNIYKLNAFSELGDSEVAKKHDLEVKNKSSPNWYQTSFKSIRGSFVKPKTVSSDVDSEKGLHIQSSTGSLEGENMQIMVSKSFVISDEQRQSRV